MNKKDIKAHIRNQLKQEYPGWDKLNKKKRKEIAREVLIEVKRQYESGELAPVSIEEQLNIKPLPANVMTIEQMEAFIEMKQKSHFKVMGKCRKSCLDPEKRVIDELLHDDVLNGLLAGPGYTPSKRIKTPCHVFSSGVIEVTGLCRNELPQILQA